MLCRLAFVVLVVLTFGCDVDAILRRCFSCRSRGDLGDCRDPFLLTTGVQVRYFLTGNSTTVGAVEGKRDGVDTPPCSSGWCSKVLENVDKSFKEDADLGTATQRDCLQRAPSDGQERCAYVTYNRKRVYMCFCKGDLCNSAQKIGNTAFIVPVAIIIGLVGQMML